MKKSSFVKEVEEIDEELKVEEVHRRDRYLDRRDLSSIYLS